MPSKHKFHGLDWRQMNVVLNVLCDMEDRVDMSEDEDRAFDIAIQSVAQIINRMLDDKKITWDDE